VTLTLLTPLCVLVVLAAALPLAAVAAGARRARAVRAALRLHPPRRGADAVALGAIAGVFVLLGLAAAQPALSHTSRREVRPDAQALFVLDTSRSMAAASGPAAPTRLARAKAAAARLRAGLPEIESGIATLTDRVLPDLLPVADLPSFDATLTRAVGIEQPPPRSGGVRATSFAALGAIARSGFFADAAKRRVVVLLTDGESTAFDPAAIARALDGVELVAVRFWRSGESVYGPSRRPEPAYRPDPAAPAALDALAAAARGRVYGEGDLGGAAARLHTLLGGGPRVAVVGRRRSDIPLAPYLALAALAPLAVLVRRRAT